jgi:23S rRNA (uracil1939-C5)-methyltransferase
MAGVRPPDGFLVNVHDRPGPYMLGPKSLLVAGRDLVREAALGPTFMVSPAAFFQTNVIAAGHLQRAVLDVAPPVPVLTVLDLYSGSGLFGLPLALRGHAVTMVEENGQAMKDAALNQKVNKVPASRLSLLHMRAEEALSGDRSRSAAMRKVDLVVVDPPRDGCPPSVIRGLFDEVRPAQVVYVSCNPDALARELPGIVAAGYRVEQVLPVDMFPHTEHIETVVTLARK